MKKLETLIKPYLLEALKDALRDEGFEGMTISEIKDYSPDNTSSGKNSTAAFMPRLKVEIVVNDDDVPSAVEAIERTRLIIAPGESVVVNEIDDVIRIRTAEHGEIAI